MQLPAALRPWHTLLSQFPSDIALALGTLVHRLHSVVGPLREDPTRGLLDPDGIQGIAQRGTYERLVLSEWLLADEIPDEFNRRAAMHEHLFYDRDLKEPSGNKESVALFDCGPEQIGAPRIVQLAALILLARRAETARARFLWGALQDDTFSLRDVVDPGAIRRFLGARTSQSLSRERVQAWKSRMSDDSERDRWIVGSRAGIAAWPEISSIVVEDLLNLEGDTLRVTVNRARRESSLELELPPRNAVRARLLRDPFEEAIRCSTHTSQHAISMKRQLRISHDGRRVLAMLLDNMLGAFHVPNSPNAKAGRTRRCQIPQHHRLVAAEYWRKSFTLITTADDCVYLHRNKSRSVQPQTLERSLQSPDPVVPIDHLGTFPRCRVSGWSAMVTGIFFLDGGGQLFAISADKRRIQRIDHGVKDFLLARDQLYYVRQYEDEDRVALVEANANEPTRNLELTGIDVEKGLRATAMFGEEHSWSDGRDCGSIALRIRSHLWRILHDGESEEVAVPEDGRVCGVVYLHTEPSSTERLYGLVVMEASRRALRLYRRNSSSSIVKTPSPIAQVAVDPTARSVAYLTELRSLQVYSMQHRKLLLSVQHQEER